jgi:hypothetical protein
MSASTVVPNYDTIGTAFTPPRGGSTTSTIRQVVSPEELLPQLGADVAVVMPMLMPASSTPPMVSIGQLTHNPVEEARPPRTRSPLAEEPAKRRFVKPEKDVLRNIERHRTSICIDSECESSSTNRNIIVSVRSLVSFIESNYICKCCHITL